MGFFGALLQHSYEWALSAWCSTHALHLFAVFMFAGRVIGSEFCVEFPRGVGLGSDDVSMTDHMFRNLQLLGWIAPKGEAGKRPVGSSMRIMRLQCRHEGQSE